MQYKLNKIIFALLLLCGWTACSDSTPNTPDTPEIPIEPTPVYPTTSFSQIKVSEVITEDGLTVTSTQTYAYAKGRLTSSTAHQSYYADEKVEIESLTTITYSNHQAIVTDASGNVSTYTLNDKGYAVSCVRREASTEIIRSYTFEYIENTEGKYYLTQITENIDGKKCASVSIDHSNFAALRIALQVDTDNQVYTATTPEGSIVPNISEIPCLFLAELYPISFHSVALYGKILGEPFQVLVSKITPDGNSGNNETTTCTYSTDDRGVVHSCRMVTNSYGTNYVRTVNYQID